MINLLNLALGSTVWQSQLTGDEIVAAITLALGSDAWQTGGMDGGTVDQIARDSAAAAAIAAAAAQSDADTAIDSAALAHVQSSQAATAAAANTAAIVNIPKVIVQAQSPLTVGHQPANPRTGDVVVQLGTTGTVRGYAFNGITWVLSASVAGLGLALIHATVEGFAIQGSTDSVPYDKLGVALPDYIRDPVNHTTIPYSAIEGTLESWAILPLLKLSRLTDFPLLAYCQT